MPLGHASLNLCVPLLMLWPGRGETKDSLNGCESPITDAWKEKNMATWVS